MDGLTFNKAISDLEEEYTQTCYQLIKNLQTISSRQQSHQYTSEEEEQQQMDVITSLQMNLVMTLPVMKALCSNEQGEERKNLNTDRYGDIISRRQSTKELENQNNNDFDEYLRELMSLSYECDLDLMKRIDSYSESVLTPSERAKHFKKAGVSSREHLIKNIKNKLKTLHNKDAKRDTKTRRIVVLRELINMFEANLGRTTV
ncbi:hypothetical protein ACO0RG_000571 [Hanseniaspora osmophila]|mgnify:CR=1 FL=1